MDDREVLKSARVAGSFGRAIKARMDESAVLPDRSLILHEAGVGGATSLRPHSTIQRFGKTSKT